MTVAQSIAKATASLPPHRQQQVLDFVEFLKTRNGASSKSEHKPLTAAERKKLHPAVRAIAGMWKDRTDFPKNGVDASKILRRRVMGRKNAASSLVSEENHRAALDQLDAAINEAAGTWKKRTDLPKNSMAASHSLRRRLMRRSGNA